MSTEHHRSNALPIPAGLAGMTLALLLQACVNGEIGWEHTDLSEVVIGASREVVESELGSPLQSRFFHGRGGAIYGYDRGYNAGAEAATIVLLAPYLIPIAYSNQRGKVLIVYSKNNTVIRRDFSDLMREFTNIFDAAKCNAGWAQHKLGHLFEYDVSEPDLVEAYFWYSAASAKGHDTAGREVDRLAQVITPEEIAEVRRLALEWEPGNCNEIEAPKRHARTH